jgi:hypothetical protein
MYNTDLFIFVIVIGVVVMLFGILNMQKPNLIAKWSLGWQKWNLEWKGLDADLKPNSWYYARIQIQGLISIFIGIGLILFGIYNIIRINEYRDIDRNNATIKAVVSFYMKDDQLYVKNNTEYDSFISLSDCTGSVQRSDLPASYAIEFFYSNDISITDNIKFSTLLKPGRSEAVKVNYVDTLNTIDRKVLKNDVKKIKLISCADGRVSFNNTEYAFKFKNTTLGFLDTLTFKVEDLK